MKRPSRLGLAALACAVGALIFQTGGSAAGTPLLTILQSELQRNFDGLKSQAAPPYFISYAVHDTHTTRINASFGAIDRGDDARARFGSVEVRVGDYTLDNTHPLRGDGGPSGPRVSRITLPLTDDDAATRAALWRATDRAFKQAAEALTRVRTNVAAKVKEDDPAPDFSREDPQTYAGPPVAFTIDRKAWEARLRRVSAPFAQDPLIFRSDATLAIDADNRSYVNTEGSQIADGELTCRLAIQAVTKAADGMELPLYANYFAATPDALPDEKKLVADVRDMMAMLAKLRAAPLVDPFSGPAILSGRAAGVFFHEIFGHRVEGHRQRNVDDAQTFAKKVNQPILPSFLNVVFDPTLRKRGGVELAGAYAYDDEGVKARRVGLVESGVLKTFLLGRTPLSAFPRSNGHGRAQPGYVPVSRQSNLIVESTHAVSGDALMNLLKEDARRQGKAFGLLFENIEGGFTFTNRTQPNAFNVLPNVVYRVYADGRPPELVRGVDLIGTPLAAFGKIVATGDTADVFNGICGAESGGVPVSASSPALLVSEVEVQKKSQSQETVPILPAPSRGEGPATQQSPIVRAMQDELTRSMAGLRMKDEPPPYYIAYRVDDVAQMRTAARLGATTDESTGRQRVLHVEVRVGDYAFDSSRFLSFDRGAGVLPGSADAAMVAPLDDDYDAFRRELWVVTDAAYKRAVTLLAKKKAAFQNRTGVEPLPDLSRETPVETIAPVSPPAARPPGEWAARARQIAVVFASAPEIYASDVAVSETRGARYVLNSEGFKAVTPVQVATLRISADTQAEDGAVLRDQINLVERSLDDLPAAAELVARARDLAARLTSARTAPVGDEFNGPILVERTASAELFAHALVPLTLGGRPPDADNPRVSAMAQAQVTPFLSRIGSRVLADGFTVADTPSLATFDGRPVPGAYRVDDEGIPAKDVTIVDNGRLVTLLANRAPQKNLPRSNGHGRAGGVVAGVFQVTSAQPVPAAALRAKYLELLKSQDKPFGYVVRDIANPGFLGDGSDLGTAPGGSGPAGPALLQVMKVTPDGKEEAVRGVRFGNVAATAFRNLLDASEERTLYNYRAVAPLALTTSGGPATVSVIAPSVIFDELEVQRIKEIAQKPPIVASPLRP